MEWIDPKYAELVATMRRAEADASEQDPSEDRPVRGSSSLTPVPARCRAEPNPARCRAALGRQTSSLPSSTRPKTAPAQQQAPYPRRNRRQGA